MFAGRRPPRNNEDVRSHLRPPPTSAARRSEREQCDSGSPLIRRCVLCVVFVLGGVVLRVCDNNTQRAPRACVRRRRRRWPAAGGARSSKKPTGAGQTKLEITSISEVAEIVTVLDSSLGGRWCARSGVVDASAQAACAPTTSRSSSAAAADRKIDMLNRNV